MKTEEEMVEEMMTRVEANDAGAICLLANHYQRGIHGLQRDRAKAIELFTRAAELGCSKAHNQLGAIYHEGGNMKKAKFHYEAAAMAGDEVARFIIGCMDAKSGNMEQAVKHWTIAASAGHYDAMHTLIKLFKRDYGRRESINSALMAYNSSCTEMRSEARDACIRIMAEAAQAQL